MYRDKIEDKKRVLEFIIQEKETTLTKIANSLKMGYYSVKFEIVPALVIENKVELFTKDNRFQYVRKKNVNSTKKA